MRGQNALLSFSLFVLNISQNFGCGTRSGIGGNGWSSPSPAPLLGRPTLIPKVLAAFQEGKDSVRKGLGQGHVHGQQVGWSPPVQQKPHPPLPPPVVIKPHTPQDLNGVGWGNEAEGQFADYGNGHLQGPLVLPHPQGQIIDQYDHIKPFAYPVDFNV